MPKPEWGVKRVCPTTGKRFYDLNRTPIISPYTGEIVQIDLPGRKGAFTAADPSKAKVALAADLDAEDVLIDDEDVAVEAEDELLDDEEDETVSFDELSDVAAEDEEP
jgi:uncharacterized protein (TIGR02300 family)